MKSSSCNLLAFRCLQKTPLQTLYIDVDWLFYMLPTGQSASTLGGCLELKIKISVHNGAVRCIKPVPRSKTMILDFNSLTLYKHTTVLWQMWLCVATASDTSKVDRVRVRGLVGGAPTSGSCFGFAFAELWRAGRGERRASYLSFGWPVTGDD